MYSAHAGFVSRLNSAVDGAVNTSATSSLNLCTVTFILFPNFKYKRHFLSTPKQSNKSIGDVFLSHSCKKYSNQ